MARSGSNLPRKYFINGLRLTPHFLFIFAFLYSASPNEAADPAQTLQSEQDAKRIHEVETELELLKSSQALLEIVQQQQQRTEAELESTLQTTSPKDPPRVPARAPEKITGEKPTAPIPDVDQGFSFVAVRTPAPEPTPPVSTGSILSPTSQSAGGSNRDRASTENPKLASLRQELRNEINAIFEKIRESRRAHYGEKEEHTSGTYVRLKSYDPETGTNKRGGKKPKLDVDLDYGLNHEFPENSSCFTSLSLAATLVRARLLRDEIIELKNQLPR